MINKVRDAAREMLGTGSKADCCSMLPAFFEEMSNRGHFGELRSADDTTMMRLVIENEKKVWLSKQKLVPEERKTEFDVAKINLEQFVPEKKYLVGFSVVPSQALACAESVSFVSTSDAGHIT